MFKKTKAPYLLIVMTFLSRPALAGPYDINMLGGDAPFGITQGNVIHLPGAVVNTNIGEGRSSEGGKKITSQKNSSSQREAPKLSPGVVFQPYHGEGAGKNGGETSCTKTEDISIMLSPKCLRQAEIENFGDKGHPDIQTKAGVPVLENRTSSLKKPDEVSLPKVEKVVEKPPIGEVFCKTKILPIHKNSFDKISEKIYPTSKDCIKESIKYLTPNYREVIIDVTFHEGYSKAIKCLIENGKTSCKIL